MKRVWSCRRTFISAFAITALTAIAIGKGLDTSMAIAAIAGVLAGANAYQGVKGAKNE